MEMGYTRRAGPGGALLPGGALVLAAALASPCLSAAGGEGEGGYDYVKAGKDWFPFVFPYRKESPKTAVNVSFLLSGPDDAPSGKRGYVESRDGHLYFEDGTRARFIGGNCGWGGWNLSHEQAEKVADYLARNGLNLVRFLLSDFRFTEEHWDHFHYLLYCLKRKGIYVYFYTAPGSGKGLGGYVPARIRMQKDFWRKLLTHENPYTKTRLGTDPMLAFIFLCNETGIFHYVRRPGHVKGGDLRILTKLWNEWLVKTYRSREGLQEAWEEMGARPGLGADEDPLKGTVPIEVRNGRRGRTYDYMRCLDELQRRYYADMIAYLRSLGVRVPISGMNRPNTYHDLRAGAETGTITGDHYYWCHMTGPGVNRTENLAMVRDVTPFSGLHAERGNRVFVGAACRGKVKGLPFGVGEWSTLSSANDFRSETQLVMACYAALHDWDFLCHFPLIHSHTNWDDVARARTTWFSTFDPARMGVFPAMSLIFLRHDVETARKVVESVQLEEPFTRALRDAPKDNIWEYLRLVAGLAPHRKLRPYYAYLSRVENVFENDPRTRADAVITNMMSPEEVFETLVRRGIHPRDIRQTMRFTSDTGQLVSDVKRGIFTVNAPRAQGAVGFLDEVGRIDLEDIVIDECSAFATVVVNSLDGEPIATSRRMLLTVVGDADNSGEKRRMSGDYASVGAVSRKRGVKLARRGGRFRPGGYQDRLKWGRVTGHGPTLVDPVDVEIALKGRKSAEIRVYALSAGGERTGGLRVRGSESGAALRQLAQGGVQSPSRGAAFRPSGRRHRTIYYEISGR